MNCPMSLLFDCYLHVHVRSRAGCRTSCRSYFQPTIRNQMSIRFASCPPSCCSKRLATQGNLFTACMLSNESIEVRCSHVGVGLLSHVDIVVGFPLELGTPTTS